MTTNDYIYFTESELYNIENQEDLNFLMEFNDGAQNLIDKSGDKFKINFVGEVVAPNNVYFSFPKNMVGDINSVDLIRRVLNKYKISKDGKELVFSKSGNYKSYRAYFNELKEYFLDFITYEFIYPLKRKKIHSKHPILGGKISIVDTDRNKKRYGTGVTYKTKDVINSDDWMIDDIYYYTIKELEQMVNASPYEKKEISDMFDYLKEEGYHFNNLVGTKIVSDSNVELVDLSNPSEVLKQIEKSDVGVIHYPIRDILIEYYKSKRKSSTRGSVNVIFTRNFEKVWEEILQDALEDGDISDSFRSEVEASGRFQGVEIVEKIIPSREKDDYIIDYPLDQNGEKSDKDRWMEERNGRYFICKKIRILIPDIFVELDNGERFIGDAKYYKDPSDANYDKEFYLYNDAQGNKYPMVIFAIPERDNINRTIVPRNGYRRSGEKELIIITVSVNDVIRDIISGGKKVLNDSISLIKKYTRKWR